MFRSLGRRSRPGLEVLEGRVLPAGSVATVTSLMPLPATSPQGVALSFTATVAAAASGNGTPGGSVEFRDGARLLGTAGLGSRGTATLTTFDLGPGSHSITAFYQGQGKYRASRSTPLPERITPVESTAFVLARGGLFGDDPTEFKGAIYFTPNGPGLWKSDGTPRGTVLVTKLGEGSTEVGIFPRFFVAGQTLFFEADDPVAGPQLWKSDGTAAGTLRVKDVPGLNWGEAAVVGKTLVFASAVDATGSFLWKSDGTPAGTTVIAQWPPQTDFNGNPYSPAPASFLAAGGKVFFQLDDEGNGSPSLFVTDGTAGGTSLLVPAYIVQAADLTPAGSRLFFEGDDIMSSGKGGLWVSDGTPGGTTLVSPVLPGPTMTAAGNGVYFGYDDGVHGNELWTSDGTASGTALFADLVPGAASSSPIDLTAVDGAVYFVASDPSHGYRLWRTSGTAPVVVPVPKDLTGFLPLGGVDGVLYFATADAAGNQQIWRTDGTAAGTVPVPLLGVSSRHRLSAYRAPVSTGHAFFVDVGFTDGSIEEVAFPASPLSAPKVTRDPASQTIEASQTATFHAGAQGDPAAAVHWQVSVDRGKTFQDVAGATSTTLTVRAWRSQNGYLYRAVFDNGLATASAAATLTVHFVPTITTQPASVTAAVGRRVRFTAAAEANPGAHVQWQVSTNHGRTFHDLPGATLDSLILTALAGQNGYRYRAVFSNSVGQAISKVALLTI